LISSASLDNTRSDIYAHGAADQVIADLRQEITDGSKATASANNTFPSPYLPVSALSDIYRPTLPGNAEPYNSGPASYTTTTWNTTFPNLVKESSAGALLYQSTPTATYANPGISRAAPVSTTTTGGYINSGSASGVSRNNRYISPATWNQALLLPKQTPTSTADLTPSQGFIAPDWILTAVDGTNPGGTGSGDTPFDSGNDKTTSNVNPQSPKYVTGRYAYTIYNEGGLLDANVAGSPGPGSTAGNLGTSSSVNGPSQQVIWSRKGPEAFADLTEIPGMTQKDVDQLVGWRNYATLGGSNPSGFPNLPSPLTGTAVDDYFGYLLGISSRFMTAGNDLTGQVTDRRFTGRQQMMSFFQNIYDASDTADRATMQNDMMYFTNFSRTLNQPSYWPDPKRPRVLSSSASSASGKDDTINAPFKAIVVRTTFTRADGTTAVVGEPLVKKRFALSRLIWLTYKGPSASVSTGDPLYQQYLKLMPQAQLTQLWNEGTAQNIENYFGLVWQGTAPGTQGGYWLYNHTTSGSAAQPEILPLSSVATLASPRDPDFFELLKAGICCGSLGATQPLASTLQDSGTGVANAQEVVDEQTDYQVFQIGVNIIDQTSPDDFPTDLVFNDTIQPLVHSMWGKKDLPYLTSVTDVPILVGGSAANLPSPVPPDSMVTSGPITGSIVTPGAVALLLVPTIWNPSQFNSKLPAALEPANQLRIDAIDFPIYFQSLAGTTEPTVSTKWNANSYSSATATWPKGSLTSAGWVTGGDPTAIYFNCDTTGLLYREPTPLLTTTVANVLNPLGTFGNGIPNFGDSSTNFIGFYVGSTAELFPNTAVPIPSSYYAVDGVQGGSAGFGNEYSLEYEVGGSWIPYQQYTMRSEFTTIQSQINADGATNYTEKLMTSLPASSTNGQAGMLEALYDPRTNRWGSAKDEHFPPFLNSTMVSTMRPTAALGIGAFENTGMATQNLPTIPAATYANVHYIATDPDGVVRRAMGAYVSTTNAGVSSSMIGLPMATVLGNSANTSNRSIILHRPFRSVAELGYTFRDTPWKNLDFFTPESGDAALLDTFCINEDERPDAVAAGRVDLNTKQATVLEALLAGTYRDELVSTDLLSTQEAKAVALTLLQRTEGTAVNQGPLENIADLVGRYVNGFTSSAANDNQPYDGFSSDLAVYRPSVSTSAAANSIQRLREVTMRALSDAGQAGTWNLMIDLVAQTGRYPANASGLADFLVQGQRHYWIHVAIDRTTGKIIDENIEPVNE